MELELPLKTPLVENSFDDHPYLRKSSSLSKLAYAMEDDFRSALQFGSMLSRRAVTILAVYVLVSTTIFWFFEKERSNHDLATHIEATWPNCLYVQI